MKKLILFVFISCNYSHPNIDVKKKVQVIDSTLKHRETRLVWSQEYLIPDSIIAGGLIRKFVFSIDSVILVITDKKQYDSAEFHFTGFFIDSTLAQIDMRAIKDKKTLFINRSYYDQDRLIFEDIQDHKQGRPSTLHYYFTSAAEKWYKKYRK